MSWKDSGEVLKGGGRAERRDATWAVAGSAMLDSGCCCCEGRDVIVWSELQNLGGARASEIGKCM